MAGAKKGVKGTNTVQSLCRKRRVTSALGALVAMRGNECSMSACHPHCHRAFCLTHWWPRRARGREGSLQVGPTMGHICKRIPQWVTGCKALGLICKRIPQWVTVSCKMDCQMDGLEGHAMECTVDNNVDNTVDCAVDCT
eukprot:1157557-Pelagomonas_calceolata.AAC.6